MAIVTVCLCIYTSGVGGSRAYATARCGRITKERQLKTLRATVAAMFVLMLMAVPALAQEGSPGDITISVSCGTDPEEVSIANNLEDLPISVLEISSVGGASFTINDEIGPGETVTYESGEAADNNVLTPSFIFDENDPEEGVIVRIGPEPILDDYTVLCNQSPESFDVIDDDQDDDQQGEIPDGTGNTGAGGMAGAAGLPIGSIAAAASLLIAAGYAAYRRR